MQFPNDIQACLLFDRPIDNLEAIVRSFIRIEEARSGIHFNVPEFKPGTIYRLFGGQKMTVMFEYVNAAPKMEMFQQALNSTITGIVGPDIRERLIRCRSHILINVSHGVLGNTPELLAMLAQIDYPIEGHSLPEFTDRLEVLGLAARVAGESIEPLAVHWTQSNQLMPGAAFDTLAAMDTPSMLHIHPYLFGGGQDADGNHKAGIRTFGMRHFIGHEVIVEPNIIPWAANFETVLALLRVAIIQNGYIIPHNDTFGPEDRSQSYRVLHREAEEGDVPLLELVPLMFAEYGFVAPDYVPLDRVIDDRMPPPELMPEDEEDKMELANEWREKRGMAEGIGGRFEVRARDLDGGSASPPPTGGPGGGGSGYTPPRPGGLGGIGPRPVFGRKIV